MHYLELSNSDGYQIILTTHSPALIRLFETSDVRFVEQNDGNSQVLSLNEAVIDKIINAMGLLPSIGKVVVCVEVTMMKISC